MGVGVVNGISFGTAQIDSVRVFEQNLLAAEDDRVLTIPDFSFRYTFENLMPKAITPILNVTSTGMPSICLIAGGS